MSRGPFTVLSFASLLTFLALAVLWVRSLNHMDGMIYADPSGRRKARGRCPQCGYDLRASPDRCPECGTMAAVPPTPPATPAPNSPR